MESFNHDTDCLMEDIDVRYLHELRGTCEGYKRDVELMAEAQRLDPDFKVMYKYKLDKKLPNDKKWAQSIQANRSAYYMDENNILYRWHTVSKGPQATTYQQLCLPHDYRPHCLYMQHDSRWAGHQGPECSWLLMEKLCYWPDVIQYCKTCDVCAQAKCIYTKSRASLSLRQVPTLFSVLHIDVMRLDKLPNGEQYLLVMVDRLTRYTEMVAMEDQTSPTIARALMDHWFYRYGLCQMIICDRNM